MIANLATAAAVISGVLFGVIELRHARREREDRAAFEVVHAILTPEWMRSAVQVQAIADGVAPAALEADARALEASHSVGIILEALGYAVYKRIVPLEVVDDLVGGTVRLAWRKLRGYIAHERARSGSQKSWEWFQWLAERLDERSGKTSLQLGAHEAHRDWRP